LPADLTRRRFLQSSAAATVAITAPALAAEPDKKPAPDAKAPATAPAKKLNLGIVGVADQGWYHVQTILPLANANIAAICDVDVRHLVRAARAIPNAEVFIDYRELLKKKDLDAVLVATPDHTHSVIASAALKAGKHVYCEKPLCHTVKEVRALTHLANETRLVTQMGIQIHSMDNYRRVVELVQAGAIGPVNEVHIWNERSHRAPKTEKITPPATFNYDLWLGPTPMRPLEADFHPYNWRRRWAFGSGMLGDIGCHLMDVAFWALDLKHLTRVTSEGGGGDATDICTEWNIATYEFPSRGVGKPPVKMTWYDPPKVPPMRDAWKLPEKMKNEGVMFLGEKGMLFTNYGEHVLLPAEQFKDYKRPATRIASTKGHQAEWINACLANDPSMCGARFSYGGPLAETALLGIAAYRAAPGKSLDWDAKNLRFTNAPEADKFLGYEFRNGWSM
jgi:predicted dehydrogenase